MIACGLFCYKVYCKFCALGVSLFSPSLCVCLERDELQSIGMCSRFFFSGLCCDSTLIMKELTDLHCEMTLSNVDRPPGEVALQEMDLLRLQGQLLWLS